jgi:hypothetical protein
LLTIAVVASCATPDQGELTTQAGPETDPEIVTEADGSLSGAEAAAATPTTEPADSSVLSVDLSGQADEAAAGTGAASSASSATTGSTASTGSSATTTPVPASALSPSTGEPATTATSDAASGETSVSAASVPGGAEVVGLRFESQVDDVPVEELIDEAMAILNDPRGWGQAGFIFVADPEGPYRVVLAEGPEVDALCLPLRTYSTVSCQNGPVVALNADRWRNAVSHWTLGVEVYRGYLVNHEVGHLIGQRHPKPRCPVAGRPAGVMEQQTAGLEGCIGNPWPRDWELEYARQRPVVYAPLPDWAPDPVPANLES